jgi:hypothetical protein
MSILGIILVVVLLLALFGSFPRWGYASTWGYQPFGILGVVLIIVLILVLVGHI